MLPRLLRVAAIMSLEARPRRPSRTTDRLRAYGREFPRRASPKRLAGKQSRWGSVIRFAWFRPSNKENRIPRYQSGNSDATFTARSRCRSPVEFKPLFVHSLERACLEEIMAS